MLLLEALMAVLVLTIGVVALVSSYDSSRHLVTSAERHDVAATRGEEEINRITSLAWASIALKTEPTVESGATTLNPSYYISKEGPCVGNGPVSKPCYQWNWTSSSSSEPLDVNAATTDATANPLAWETNVSTSGGVTRLTGKTYRYVTWANDTNCTQALCKGTTDYKRITVAVTVSGMKAPVELSTFVTDPEGEYDPVAQTGVTCTNQGVTVPCIG